MSEKKCYNLVMRGLVLFSSILQGKIVCVSFVVTFVGTSGHVFQMLPHSEMNLFRFLHLNRP